MGLYSFELEFSPVLVLLMPAWLVDVRVRSGDKGGSGLRRGMGWGGPGREGGRGAEMDTGTKLSDEAVTPMFCVDLMSLNNLNFRSVLLIKEADRYK